MAAQTLAGMRGPVDVREPDMDPVSASAQALDAHGHNIYLDSSISFEAYHFWAERAREEEKHFETESVATQFKKLFSREKKQQQQQLVLPDDSAPIATAEKDGSSPAPDKDSEARFGITAGEWEHANRAARTATWTTIFYLITTDILGPYAVPWALAQMGYGPGITLYVVFAGFAAYGGFLLWWQFVGLDSPKYPLRNYGDLGFRVYGNWARQIINVLQSCQFFLNVTLLIVTEGQGLAQMAQGPSGNGFLCFVVAQLIFMLLGFLLGQIRTLQRLGFLANVAVWLNVFVIIMSMIVIPIYGPKVAAFSSYKVPPGQPISVTAYWPEGSTVTDHINGLMNAVFAYGGATLFVELMAEMRRPMDFYKGFICAEIFIFVVYITIGTVVYSFQGQYTYNPVYQGIPNSAYAWQTVGNAIAFISGLIAALLYGNIGVKILYAAVLRDVFGFPPLETRVGKITWIIMVPVYWACAFLIAAAVPQISYLGAFVGAAFILQFSYTFPPILQVGYNVQKDAMLPEEVFDPATGEVNRVDSGFRRIVRGYMKKPFRNTFDSIYFVCSLATAGLGMYAAIIGMSDAFSSNSLTSFTCINPAG